MLSTGTKIGDLEWPWTAKWPLFLPNLVISGAYYVKVVDRTTTMDNLRLLCLVVNVCRGTARRPRYKYSITERWKFCSRFINSRHNMQYLPSYRIICWTKYVLFFGILKYVCDIVVKTFTFVISSTDEFLFVYVPCARLSCLLSAFEST